MVCALEARGYLMYFEIEIKKLFEISIVKVALGVSQHLLMYKDKFCSYNK